MNIVIHTDGGSRGNPGQAAIGFCVLQDETVVYEQGSCIGIATNNEAEYQALITSLKWLQEYLQTNEVEQITWKLDSKLVVEQVNRNWKIKEARLQELVKQCWQHLESLHVPHTLQYVPRAQNACADALVNQALDAQRA